MKIVYSALFCGGGGCCFGSLLLHAGFLQLRRVGATHRCGARAFHCSGFSCCRAQALGTRASVVAERSRLSACRTQALECASFSSWGAWAQQLWLAGSRAQAQQLWHTASVARHVRSSWTRDRTSVPCIRRQILNHCASKEVPALIFFYLVFFPLIHKVIFCLIISQFTKYSIRRPYPYKQSTLGQFQKCFIPHSFLCWSKCLLLVMIGQYHFFNSFDILL